MKYIGSQPTGHWSLDENEGAAAARNFVALKSGEALDDLLGGVNFAVHNIIITDETAESNAARILTNQELDSQLKKEAAKEKLAKDLDGWARTQPYVARRDSNNQTGKL